MVFYGRRRWFAPPANFRLATANCFPLRFSRSSHHRAALSGAGNLRRGVAMHPNTVHDPETEHDHQDERTAVTDQGQRHARDWQHRDRHAHVLKDMREDEGGDSSNKEQTKLIASKERDEKTGQQEQAESTNQKHSADETPLLTDGGKNVIVVHGGGG